MLLQYMARVKDGEALEDVVPALRFTAGDGDVQVLDEMVPGGDVVSCRMKCSWVHDRANDAVKSWMKWSQAISCV